MATYVADWQSHAKSNLLTTSAIAGISLLNSMRGQGMLGAAATGAALGAASGAVMHFTNNKAHTLTGSMWSHGTMGALTGVASNTALPVAMWGMATIGAPLTALV